MKGSRTQAALRTVPVLMLVAGIVLTMHCPKPNLPPDVPDPPSGVTHGIVGTSYEFSAFAVDPEGGELSIRFDWGDGDTSGWSAFAPSGDTVTMSHSWTGPGEYPVRAQARSRADFGSEWSEPLVVRIIGEPGTLRWRYETGGEVISCPAIGDDGTVYVGSEDSCLYAINPDGSLKWRYRTDDLVSSSPSIGDDGTVYVASGKREQPGYLYAVNPDGTPRWRYDTNGRVYSAPSIGADGTIYIGTAYPDTSLLAINPDGTLKWRYEVSHAIRAAPAIAADGTVYVGSSRYLYAVNPDGTLKWSHRLDTSTGLSIAIAADGAVYVVADGLYAVNPDGSRRWHVRGETSGSTLAVATDGTVYFGLTLDVLCAFSPDGSLKWWFDTGGLPGVRSVHSSAVAADGTVYVSSADLCLWALGPDGTPRWRYETKMFVFRPAIGPDGTVYVALGNNLDAIYGDSPLADSPWPKYGSDSRNTGRVRRP